MQVFSLLFFRDITWVTADPNLRSPQKVQRRYLEQDVRAFGRLIDDQNILHQSMQWDVSNNNEVDADEIIDRRRLQRHVDMGFLRLDETKQRTVPIVHGIMLSSMFSSIFANLAPGAVYLKQSLDFVKPAYVGDIVVGRVDIERFRSAPGGGLLVQCTTTVRRLEDGRVLPDDEDGDTGCETSHIIEAGNDQHENGDGVEAVLSPDDRGGLAEQEDRADVGAPTKLQDDILVRGSAKVWLPTAYAIKE